MGEGEGHRGGTGRRALTSGSPSLYFSLCLSVCLSLSLSQHLFRSLLLLVSETSLHPASVFKDWFACFSNHQELQANRG